MLNRMRGAIVAAAAIGLMTGVANAQQFGVVQLNNGFTPDPHQVSVTAGGNLDAARMAPGCVGWVSGPPSVAVDYNAGDWPLIFSTESASDTTLVVRLPDGSYLCDDDSGGNLNAMVEMASPATGRYEVWVGAYSADATGQAATLNISELARSAINWQLPANYGHVELTAGFTPDPHVVELAAGGTIAVQNTYPDCRGYVTAAPDFDVVYTAGDWPLYIRAFSQADTTLIVRAPDGNYYCDDDTFGFNPQVYFPTPQPGLYDIWVGTYAEGDAQPAQLHISELDHSEVEGPSDPMMEDHSH